MKFSITKSFGGYPLVWRNHLATTHCNLLHGYCPTWDIEFTADMLSDEGWIINFGSLKGLASIFGDIFDHSTLLAYNDPFVNKYLEHRSDTLQKTYGVDGNGHSKGYSVFTFHPRPDTIPIRPVVFNDCPVISCEYLTEFIRCLTQDYIRSSAIQDCTRGYRNVKVSRVNFYENSKNSASTYQ